MTAIIDWFEQNRQGSFSRPGDNSLETVPDHARTYRGYTGSEFGDEVDMGREGVGGIGGKGGTLGLWELQVR